MYIFKPFADAFFSVRDSEPTIRKEARRQTNLFLICLLLYTSHLSAQPQVNDLKALSIEELMNIEVTLVSRQSEKLAVTPAAIQVLTGEIIRRSSAVRLPEVLRLAPNLQVAQTSSHSWAITARGFNGAPYTSNSLSNKLLVMMDGRTIYTPLFGGVFWDAQNVLLEDIEQIEVVSGPGATMWGANAVNGVINIQRKPAKQTQGFYATGALGTFINHDFGIRYGGKLGEDVYFRVYGLRQNNDHTFTLDDESAADRWKMNQAGFRLDYEASDRDRLTVQGDFYGGSESGLHSNHLDGQNLLARWEHTVSETSDVRLQVYADRTRRSQPVTGFREELFTYDIDLQHTFSAGDRHRMVIGAGYRFMQDRIVTAPSLMFAPADLNFSFANAFFQDNIRIVKDRLRLILGTKLSKNHYSGLGLQPSARIAWTPDETSGVWLAVSHALRSASRVDTDLTVPIMGHKTFRWEKLTALELGYRLGLSQRANVSLVTFLNYYDDLRSIDSIGVGGVGFRNHQKATSWGGEFAFNYHVFDRWKIRGGYTYMSKTFQKEHESVMDGSDTFESLDPTHQALLHSMIDLPGNFSFDMDARYVGALSRARVGVAELSPAVPSYFTFNMRLGWVWQSLDFSVVGRNLWNRRVQEFGASKIPRNVYARITLRL